MVKEVAHHVAAHGKLSLGLVDNPVAVSEMSKDFEGDGALQIDTSSFQVFERLAEISVVFDILDGGEFFFGTLRKD